MKNEKLHPIVGNINKIVENNYSSKKAFAAACGFPEPKWNKISNGNQDLSLWGLSKIAETLKMPIQDIITYPYKYVKKGESDPGERVSVTFEVAPDKIDTLLKLIAKNN